MNTFKTFALAAATLSTAVAGNFDGFYSGINLGWAHQGTKVTASSNSTSQTKSFKGNGATVGLQAGYGLTTASTLYAAGELNFNYDGFARKKETWNLSSIGWGNTDAKVRKVWHMALAAKGGYNFGMGVAYVGGFLGLASHELKATYAGGSGTLKRRGFIYGPLVGAEFKVTDRLTAGLESRWDFGTAKKKQISNRTFKAKPDGFDVRARVNFAF